MAHKDNKHHSILNNVLLLAKYKNYAYIWQKIVKMINKLATI